MVSIRLVSSIIVIIMMFNHVYGDVCASTPCTPGPYVFRLNYNRTSLFTPSQISPNMGFFNETILNADVAYAIGYITTGVQKAYPIAGIKSYSLKERVVLFYSNGSHRVFENEDGFVTNLPYSSNIKFITWKRTLYAFWEVEVTGYCDLSQVKSVLYANEYGFLENLIMLTNNLDIYYHLKSNLFVLILTIEPYKNANL